MSSRSTNVRVLVGMAVLVAAVLAWAAWRERTSRAIRPAQAADSTAPGLRHVTLAVPSPEGDALVAESREILDVGDLHAQVASLVALLATEPEGEGASVLPPGTTARHVFLDVDGELTVDFSKTLLERVGLGSRMEDLMFGSLVRTLAANVPGVRRVRVLVAGAPIAVPGAHLPLDDALDPGAWSVESR